MKFNCGPSEKERVLLQKEEVRILNEVVEKGGGWHSWFAWYPVRLGEHDCRWLERVERRHKGWFININGGTSAWTTEYRLLTVATDAS